ncbi:hypothetical protein LOZ80_25735 [Paenibacillus sp. HWE-109]|uniref:hypothetical protein n=1 Tax=Paenibacillus sp. HWE-109 TaxID=1306526 RepID=UPI001EDEA9DB|nr:hypothetical protein [Paenibacillus sp. HWE-109]UKS24982.1 hypothetical protein LOZ80_25735 [Paenibacillus sp. HWE-109]
MVKKKRVLWLINHKTLRKFEVPMLIDLGYEVYTPKVFPYDEGNMSASIDYSYDATLTIPQDDIDKLNQVNFYEYLPEDILSIINDNFEVCIFSFFPRQFKELVRKYTGILVFRPFGLDNSINYTQVLMSIFGISIFNELEKLKHRFYFGQAFENLKDVEVGIFHDRALTLPIGLDGAIKSEMWKGEKDRILFVCPRIETSDYFKRIYDDFIKNFKEYDYLVGGAQPIQPMDEKVIGFLSDEDYQDMYLNSRLMYYHSKEKRHIHYHPFEAVKCGLPLIFMGGGILDQLGGKNLPGRCKNINEAKRKVKRLINGDKAFIDKIRSSQHVLLGKMSYEYCMPIWKENFKKIQENMQISFKEYKSPKKIAVILGEEYTGGVLDYAIRLLTALKRGIDENQSNLELVFGHVDHLNYVGKNYFEKIEEMGITVRPFEWRKVDNEQIKEMISTKFGASFVAFDYDLPEYYMLDDKVSGFADCDYLIFAVDRVPGRIFTFQPYAVCIHDYIQRYLPGMLGGYYESHVIEMTRRADAVIANTDANFEDAIQYLGIPKEILRKIPLLFESYKENEQVFYVEKKPESKLYLRNKERDYFLWSTNVTAHKNHKVVLEGLSEYYQKNGTLICFVTGHESDKFDVKKEYNGGGYIADIRDLISRDEGLKKNVIFKGNLPKATYIELLKKAKFLLHGGIIDNGNMSVFDAALHGIPSISSRYHAMENYENYMNLGLRFFNPDKPKELANLLLKTEVDYKEFGKRVPSYESLIRFTIDHTYKEIFNVFKELIKF